MAWRYQWTKCGDDHNDLMHFDTHTQTLTFVRNFKSKANLGSVPGARNGGENEADTPDAHHPPITRALDELKAKNDPDLFTFSRQQMNAITEAARYVCLLGNPWIRTPPPPPPPGK